MTKGEEEKNPIELLLYQPKEDLSPSLLIKNIEEAITKIVLDMMCGKYSINEASDLFYNCRVALSKGVDEIKKHYDGDGAKDLSKFLRDKYYVIYGFYDIVTTTTFIDPDEKKSIILYN